MKTLKNINILVVEHHEQVTKEELETVNYAVRKIKNNKLKVVKDRTGILSDKSKRIK